MIAATTAGDVHLLRIASTSINICCQKKEGNEVEEEEKEEEMEDEDREKAGEKHGEENDHLMGVTIGIETSYKLAGEIYSTPIVGFDRRTIYVGCRDDSCHCLFLEDIGSDLHAY